jgi:hypothetical protein
MKPSRRFSQASSFEGIRLNPPGNEGEMISQPPAQKAINKSMPNNAMRPGSIILRRRISWGLSPLIDHVTPVDNITEKQYFSTLFHEKMCHPLDEVL